MLLYFPGHPGNGFCWSLWHPGRNVSAEGLNSELLPIVLPPHMAPVLASCPQKPCRMFFPLLLRRSEKYVAGKELKVKLLAGFNAARRRFCQVRA